MRQNHLVIILLSFLVMVCTGCTSTPKNENEMDMADPHESFNRKSYWFTDVIDRNILEPVADVYIEHVPVAIQRPIGNFYRNLAYPNVALNAFLQGKIRQGFEDSLRFAINSTIGIFGLADMAGHMGFKEHDEDFGQILGVWGLNSGSYIFVPVYGPSSQRDIADLPVSLFTDALFYASYAISGPIMIPLVFLRVVDKRARLSGPMKIRDQSALDPYLFVREAYTQQREFLIHDGNPPTDRYNHLYIDIEEVDDDENDEKSDGENDKKRNEVTE
ncbi:VacJ family lipoprotein [Nitrosomonas sp. Nm34]|uniref:MlaA family lipoprotein n=1 Tax=Nitrosomonas sp. Nm34 TaxID=1881055 RepID=UPI0008EE12B9|nr:VacJ family lipoprotein [Nitrosomonas sp. Nm34]SFI28099.1 phospholipid-binding lipoprotein MlaA [Nitrosomonas sp. Nm34]